MSTEDRWKKNEATIAFVDYKKTLGGEDFHTEVHAMKRRESGDDLEDLYIAIWQQGVLCDCGITVQIPQKDALEWIDGLSKWAAKTRKFLKERGDEREPGSDGKQKSS